VRELLNVTEQCGDHPVIGLQPIDGRGELWRRPPYRREEDRVLAAVVRLERRAITKAVDPQLEQWAAGLQGFQFHLDVCYRGTVGHSGRQALQRDQIPSQHLVDPAQLGSQGIWTRSRPLAGR
jgi:hypothetical protein